MFSLKAPDAEGEYDILIAVPISFIRAATAFLCALVS
jgi:hypothetical protein